MTIKEAVEFYNQQKEEIHILKQTKENAMSNIVFDKGPLGDIYISKEDALIMLDVLDKYIAILEESLNEEFNNRCQDQEGR